MLVFGAFLIMGLWIKWFWLRKHEEAFSELVPLFGGAPFGRKVSLFGCWFSVRFLSFLFYERSE